MTTAGVTTRICDLCGSPMVRSVAKTGFRAGKPLWRCTDFGCPRVINIEDGEDETPDAPRPGESAQATYERLRAARTERLLRAVPFLAGIGVLVAAGGFFLVLALSQLVWLAAATAAVIVGATMWLVMKQPPEVIYWGQGAEAERRVGVALDSLEPHGFVTLYDRRVPGRGGNIDSITVGPPGVFVVESKWRGRGVEIINGRLEVGGREQPDAIRQVLELALLVQFSAAQWMNLHRLTVVPVICVGNRRVSGGERAGGVLVVDAHSIARRLSREPALLTPGEVQELAGLLDRALPPYERRRDPVT